MRLTPERLVAEVALFEQIVFDDIVFPPRPELTEWLWRGEKMPTKKETKAQRTAREACEATERAIAEHGRAYRARRWVIYAGSWGYFKQLKSTNVKLWRGVFRRPEDDFTRQREWTHNLEEAATFTGMGAQAVLEIVGLSGRATVREVLNVPATKRTLV